MRAWVISLQVNPGSQRWRKAQRSASETARSVLFRGCPAALQAACQAWIGPVKTSSSKIYLYAIRAYDVGAIRFWGSTFAVPICRRPRVHLRTSQRERARHCAALRTKSERRSVFLRRKGGALFFLAAKGEHADALVGHITSFTRITVASRCRPTTSASRSASRFFKAAIISSCSATALAHFEGSLLPT